jgi:hypothetical protein
MKTSREFRDCSNKGRMHLCRPTRHSHFSLATRRRIIHSGLLEFGPNFSLVVWPTKVVFTIAFLEADFRSVVLRQAE